MLRSFIVCGLLFASTTAAADKPAWCAQVPEDAHFDLKYAVNKDEPRYLADVAAALCSLDPDAVARRRELQMAAKRWSKRLELSDSDWADVAAWTAARLDTRFDTKFAVDPQGKRDGYGPIRRAWSSFGALDQYAAIKSGLYADNGNAHDYTYLTDALGAKLTETGRLAYIEMCLDGNVAEQAVCQGDIDALDRKKVIAELRADRSYSGYERMLVRLGLDALPTRLAARATTITAAKQRDDAYGKLFAIAATARKDWSTHAAANGPLLDLVAQMDDARATSSRKAYAGCGTKTWAAFRAALGSVPAKHFEGISNDGFTYLEAAIGIAGNSFAAYNAAIALYACHVGLKQDDVLIATIGSAYQRWPGFRGPRTAALTAMMTAGLELDDASAKIEFPPVYRAWLTGSSSGGNIGTVAKLERDGAKVKIKFAKKLEKQQQCASSRTTNRLVHITASGTFVYRSICTGYKTVVVDKAPEPEIVSAHYAEALVPGMNAMVGNGVVIAAWKKGSKAPAVIAGVAVK